MTEGVLSKVRSSLYVRVFSNILVRLLVEVLTEDPSSLVSTLFAVRDRAILTKIGNPLANCTVGFTKHDASVLQQQ